MAEKAKFKNTSGHPLTVGETDVGAGEWARLDSSDDEVKAAVEAGHLTAESKATTKGKEG